MGGEPIQQSQYIGGEQKNRSVYLDNGSQPSNNPFTPSPVAQHSVYFTGQRPNQSMYAQERQSFFNSRTKRSKDDEVSTKDKSIPSPQPTKQSIANPSGPPTTPDIKLESSGGPAGNAPIGNWFGFKHLFSEYCYNKPETVNLGRAPILRQDRVAQSDGDDSGDTSGEDTTSNGKTERILIPVPRDDIPNAKSKPKTQSLSKWSDRESTNRTIILPDGSANSPNSPKSASPVGSAGSAGAGRPENVNVSENRTELNSLLLDHAMGKEHEFIKPSNEYFAGRDAARPVHEPRDHRMFPNENQDLTSDPKATSMWSKLFSVWSQSSYGSNK